MRCGCLKKWILTKVNTWQRTGVFRIILYIINKKLSSDIWMLQLWGNLGLVQSKGDRNWEPWDHPRWFLIKTEGNIKKDQQWWIEKTRNFNSARKKKAKKHDIELTDNLPLNSNYPDTHYFFFLLFPNILWLSIIYFTERKTMIKA